MILRKKFSAAARPSWASRSAAAIRGRKKPCANRIREFNVYRGLKRMKNEYISTKRIPENLRRNLPDVRRKPDGKILNAVPRQ